MEARGDYPTEADHAAKGQILAFQDLWGYFLMEDGGNLRANLRIRFVGLFLPIEAGMVAFANNDERDTPTEDLSYLRELFLEYGLVLPFGNAISIDEEIFG